MKVDVAYRLGTPPREGSSYARPILMRFVHMADRNKVWRERTPITPEDSQRKITIHQDLPKRLREDSQILHRVLRTAHAYPKYKNARIQDYNLIMNGRKYSPAHLERLPKPLRPSTLASRSSDTALVFFTRYSVLSNHYPSPFCLKGVHYANIEHFLAYQRSLKSDDQDLIDRAHSATDPLKAKSILSILKNILTRDWEQDETPILETGLKEKFRQNPKLLQYQHNTGS